MRAGKTTELLRVFDRLSVRKAFVSHVLHRADSRTHGGREYAVNQLVANLTAFVRAHVETFDALFVDEAQFFELDDFREAISCALACGRSVYVAGLDRDYEKTAYPWTSAIEWTQQVKLGGRCQRCTDLGSVAVYTAYEGPPFADGKFVPESKHFVTCCARCWTLPGGQK